MDPASQPDSDFEIKSVRPLSEAGEGDLSFLTNPKYKSQALKTGASAILVSKAIEGCSALQLVCKNPHATLARILSALFPEPEMAPGIHPSAAVDPSAKIAPDCHIGAFCVVEAGCEIGAGSVLQARVTVMRNSKVGEDVRLFPGVVIYDDVHLGNGVRIHANTVVGSDGFGYAQDGGVHVKVPQIAGVRIENNVEIGSNVSIDRGANSNTIIGEGSKIDNLVQIGHGVKIGKHSIIVSQTGISGSSKVGNYSVLAGKVGVVGHVAIGDQVVVMGQSVVTKNLDKPGQYAGNPAVPHMQYQRQLVQIRKLPKLEERVKKIEKALKNERNE